MSKTRSERTYRLALLAIFIAIIVIQALVPMLGYIKLPGVSITFIQVTVILGCLLIGRKEGVLLGFTWGLMSLIRAALTGSPLDQMLFLDPLISILPRMLMPLILSSLINALRKTSLTQGQVGSISGLLGSLLNTLLVLAAIGLFKGEEYTASLAGTASGNLWKFLGSLVVINGIPEAIVSSLITPILYKILLKVKRS